MQLNDVPLTSVISESLLRQLRQVMAQKYAGSGYSLVVHGEEVGILSEQIACILFRHQPDCKEMAHLAYVAGVLHDYGKIVVPVEIRFSRQVFSDSERQVMEYHPLYGKMLLESVECHEQVVAAARNHHLHFNGGGYPASDLVGDQIPIISRIVTVADHFIARIEHRPYRRGQIPHEVWTDMWKQRNVLFDPRILAAFEETQMFQEKLGLQPIRLFA